MISTLDVDGQLLQHYDGVLTGGRVGWTTHVDDGDAWLPDARARGSGL